VVDSRHDLQVIGTFILAYGEAMDRLRETEGDVAEEEPF